VEGGSGGTLVENVHSPWGSSGGPSRTSGQASFDPKKHQEGQAVPASNQQRNVWSDPIAEHEIEKDEQLQGVPTWQLPGQTSVSGDDGEVQASDLRQIVGT
jgi:hypothetical protein